MTEPVYRMVLDINAAGSKAQMNVRQGENGRGLQITLYQGNRPYFAADDCRAALSGTRPDGVPFLNDCVIENGRILCELTLQNTSALGSVDAELRLYGPDEELIISPTFLINVTKPAMEEGELADGPEATALTRLISEAAAAIKAANASVIKAAAAELIEDGGEPAAAVELEQNEDGQTLHLELSNLRGPQGEPGPAGEGSISDDEALDLLAELDLLPAVTDGSGAILTDENGNIILRY